MTNEEIVKSAEPYYPVLRRAFGLAWVGVRYSVSLFGIPNRVERAGIMHLAIRSELRPVCDRMEPGIRLVEQVDGLDYMLIDTGEKQGLALRWGRYGDGHIRRNPTTRQETIQDQGVLPFSEGRVDDSTGIEPVAAAIGYTVEDDYIEGGVPQWRMGRLALLREGRTTSEYIHDIHVYQRMVRFDEPILERSVVEIREKERRRLERLADRIRLKLG